MDSETFNQLMLEIETTDMVGGLSMTDLLEFPESLRLLLSWMMREKGFQLEDLCSYLSQDQSATRLLLEKLISKGFVEEVSKEAANKSEEDQYQIHMRSSRNYRVPKKIWQVFED